MDMNENNLGEHHSQSNPDSSEVVAENDSTSEPKNIISEHNNILWDSAVSNSSNSLQLNQSVSDSLKEQNENGNSVQLEGNDVEVSVTGDVLKNDQVLFESLENLIDLSFLNSDSYCNGEQCDVNTKANENQVEAIIKVVKPLCADYKSGSDSESVDSESDSSTTTTSSTTETSSDSEDDDSSQDSSADRKPTAKSHEKKSQNDMTLSNLPPIEDLSISVAKEACVDIGTITNIVDVLVVVESYKGTAALDLDTVLFLDCGRRTLGKVFDILGPITEPVYTIRFNSQEQIENWNIRKGQKVYFAPKTKHTNFVFMAEVLKNRGTDASWKDNVEAPAEFQDFSDDEEENLHRNKQTQDSNKMRSDYLMEQRSRKRRFRQTYGASQPSRFSSPDSEQSVVNFQENPPVSPRLSVCSFSTFQASPVPYNPPPVIQLNTCLFPRFPAPPPMLSFECVPFVNQNQNFHRPFCHQRMPHLHQTFTSWERPMCRPLFPQRPPPPPPLPPQPPQPLQLPQPPQPIQLPQPPQLLQLPPPQPRQPIPLPQPPQLLQLPPPQAIQLSPPPPIPQLPQPPQIPQLPDPSHLSQLPQPPQLPPPPHLSQLPQPPQPPRPSLPLPFIEKRNRKFAS